jgi:hypothetical protein
MLLTTVIKGQSGISQLQDFYRHNIKQHKTAIFSQIEQNSNWLPKTLCVFKITHTSGSTKLTENVDARDVFIQK